MATRKASSLAWWSTGQFDGCKLFSGDVDDAAAEMSVMRVLSSAVSLPTARTLMSMSSPFGVAPSAEVDTLTGPRWPVECLVARMTSSLRWWTMVLRDSEAVLVGAIGEALDV